MDSLDLFDKPTTRAPAPPERPKRAPKKRQRRPVSPPQRAAEPPRPLWLVLLLSSLLPGVGHIILGKTREGLAILLSLLGVGLIGIVGFALGLESVNWLTLRASMVLSLFGICDATLLCQEMADRRDHEYPDRPRSIAFLNLIGYGAGYWKMDEKKWAVIAGSLGVVFHLGLSYFDGFATFLGEVVLLTAAVHGYMLARGFGRKPAHGSRWIDSTPQWLIPSLASVCIAGAVFALVSNGVNNAFQESLSVDHEKSVLVEPYYTNPKYGMEVQMNAPGWAFGPTAPDEFISARHVAEDVTVRMRIKPRVPMVPGQNELQLDMALNEAEEVGYRLHATHIEPIQLGNVKGQSLLAEGTHLGKNISVEIITGGKGFRQYVIWCEWGPAPGNFAANEIDFMLRNLLLE